MGPRSWWRIAARALAISTISAIPFLLLGLLVTGPAAAAGAVRGEASVTVKNGFGRLLFHLAEDVESRVYLADGILIIMFRYPVDIDVEHLSASAPDYIGAARRDPDGKGLRIALSRKVTMNSMAAAERLFVDLLPEGWSSLPPGLPPDVIEDLATRARIAERKVRQQRAEPQQAKTAPIRVRVASQPTFTRYTFELPRQIGVVANNGKDRLTLVFDALLEFDLADAKATLPRMVGGIDSEIDQDSAVVRFMFAEVVDVRIFREDLNYVVDVTSMAPKESRARGSVRLDDLPDLAADLARGKAAAPAPAIGPPPTAPAQTAPKVLSGESRGPALPQTAPSLAARNEQAVVKPQVPAAVPPADSAETKLKAATVRRDPASAASQPPAMETLPLAAPASVVRPAAPPAAGDTKVGQRAHDAVNVTPKRQGDNLSLLFPFAAATPAAMFLRADTLWLVFDTEAEIGLAALEGETSHTIKSATLTRRGDVAVLRLKLERPRLVSTATDGPRWTVTIGAEVVEPTKPLSISRNIIGRTRSSITIPFDDPRHLHRIPDPDAGDTLLIVTALGPGRGFVKSQDFVEVRALASAHGVALQPHADDLSTELAARKIVVSRPLGLTLSRALNGGPHSANTAYQPHVIDAQAWSFDQQSDFRERKTQLIQNASEAKEGRQLIARAELARFYLARGMGLEAKAVLDVALEDSPPSAEDPSPLVLRAVAAILSGRPEQGLKDLASPFVGNQHDAPLWRALALARQGKWSEAREGFGNAGTAMGTLPIELQRTLLTEIMRASIEVGDITGAINQKHEFETVGVPRELEPTLSVLTGRLEERLGHIDAALRSYRLAAESWDRPAAAQGRLREVVLRRRIGSLTPADAIVELETLTTVWRGDETEVEALQLLARLYTEEGHYRDAFHIKRIAAAAHPESEITRRIHDEVAETFDSLFLGGKADALPPIDALSLFYDFRDLTPIGRRGDEMIRRLAERLVAVDLLDQAAELLQHQVDHRLQGAARASIATHLAVIYLSNRKPDRALATLRATRTAELSNEVRNHRLLIEARALSELGRHEMAFEVVANIEGPEAIRLRSDILWSAKRWREAAEQIELLYGERWRDFQPFSAAERIDLLRAGIGYALGEDALGLARFRERFAGKMGEGADQRAFEVVTAPIGISGTEFREIARTISQVNTLDSFLRDLRTRYSDGAPPADQRASPAKPEPVKTAAAPPG